MARNKTPPFLKKGNDKHDRFVMIFQSLVLSKSYIALPGGCKAMLIDILMMYNPSKAIEAIENGEPVKSNLYFKYSFSLAQSRGVATNTATFFKYIKLLEQAGFIKKVMSGHTNRTENVYKYSEDWKKS